MRCKKCNAVISSQTLNCPCCGQYNSVKKNEAEEAKTPNEINSAEVSNKKKRGIFWFLHW